MAHVYNCAHLACGKYVVLDNRVKWKDEIYQTRKKPRVYTYVAPDFLKDFCTILSALLLVYLMQNIQVRQRVSQNICFFVYKIHILHRQCARCKERSAKLKTLQSRPRQIKGKKKEKNKKKNKNTTGNRRDIMKNERCMYAHIVCMRERA